MHCVFILSAMLLLLAAILWYTQARGAGGTVPGPPASPAKEPEAEVHAAAALAGAVAALQELMEHPDLGGPGFLTLRIEEGSAAITAQYPNIREALYRRVVRRKLDPTDLLPAGVPRALMGLSPEFETESGGMVLVTVRMPVPDAFLIRARAGVRERQAVVSDLAEGLRRRCPALSIRAIGGELILTPCRDAAPVMQE